MEKIGFGGSCHWCTEAIFQALNGVDKVEQGWIASIKPNANFSEAVIVTFDPEIISLAVLIEVHLYTHSCTAIHSMRSKYRSAIYFFNSAQHDSAVEVIFGLRDDFSKPIITTIIPFSEFKLNSEIYLNYYNNNPEKPFCKNYITPKLKLLINRFRKHIHHPTPN